ncbi:MAG: hypothetical protein HY722_02500 [Planctomycetes bacterium]|nr:hypothetical protein [Planctomycetota bacterium]
MGDPLESVVCNLCGADQERELYPSNLPEGGNPPGRRAFSSTTPGYGVHLRIVQCLRCELAHATPRYGPSELLDTYMAWLADRLHPGRLVFRLNFGDVVTAYGRKRPA